MQLRWGHANVVSRKVYDEKFHSKGKKSEGLQLSYPRLAGNQGWTKSIEGSWDINQCEDDKYVSLHDLPNPISTPTEDLLAKIIDKKEGSYTIFQVMKSDVSTLSTTVISHSTSIKLLEENIGRLVTFV
ncbi:hypothetical protein KY285_023550 [Solanum tuberosum]|nr:hypothetical protein KY285_023550 [Solanum tuberosum]